MLLGLHVKNLALIAEEEIEFAEGLNILTGETGAGKSIIMGSIALALGAKADKELIRDGAPFALIELTFQLTQKHQFDKALALDLPVEEDGLLVIKRKIAPNRSTCTVCGETVTARQLKDLASCLIDIYGQRENQSLLSGDQQRRTVDDYAGEKATALCNELAHCVKDYQADKQELEEDMDETLRQREYDLLTYEVQEISDAELIPGEDESLETSFRKLSSYGKIADAVTAASSFIGESEDNVSDQMGRALRELHTVNGIDNDLDEIISQLTEIEDLLHNVGRDLSSYLDQLSFDPAELSTMEERLNVINHLKDKYGNTIEAILAGLESRSNRLMELDDYENHRKNLEKQLAEKEAKIRALCNELHEIRVKAAAQLSSKMQESLLALNFQQAIFQIAVTADDTSFGTKGWDNVEFKISMNPGEAPRPLSMIASGGELSRIMLALKTVQADQEDTDTLIFDEIDAGISGQTAWKVSEKLGTLAKHHQIMCITHLPQIAAMEDVHFGIRKESEEGRTYTHVTRLSEEESTEELARLLGGEKITKATMENAAEMKAMADGYKKGKTA